MRRGVFSSNPHVLQNQQDILSRDASTKISASSSYTSPRRQSYQPSNRSPSSRNYYVGMPVEELRRIKEECIEKLDFSEVDTINEVLDSRSKDVFQDFLCQCKEHLSSMVDDLFQNYYKATQKSYNNAYNEEVKHRKSIDKLFHETQRLHFMKLSDIETERSYTLVKEDMRPVMLQKQYEEKAKLLARSNNIEEANQYMAMAKEERDKELIKRRKEVNGKFDKLVSNAINVFKKEMKTINDKLTGYIDNLWTKHNAFTQGEQRRIQMIIKAAPTRVFNHEISRYFGTELADNEEDYWAQIRNTTKTFTPGRKKTVSEIRAEGSLTPKFNTRNRGCKADYNFNDITKSGDFARVNRAKTDIINTLYDFLEKKVVEDNMVDFFTK